MSDEIWHIDNLNTEDGHLRAVFFIDSAFLRIIIILCIIERSLCNWNLRLNYKVVHN